MSDATIDVLVIGAGVTGLAVAAHMLAHRPLRLPRRTASSSRHGDQHPQQRRDPRRPLLSRGHAQGAAVRRRRAPPLSTSAPRTACRTIAAASWSSHRTTTRWPHSRRSPTLGTANGAEGLEIVGRGRSYGGASRMSAAVAALWSPEHRTGRGGGARAPLLRLAEAARRDPAAARPVHRRRAAAADGLRCAAPSGRRLPRAWSSTPRACYADEVSAALGGEPFTIYPCRGEYAELKPSRRHWINGLVYPLPASVRSRPRRPSHEDHRRHRCCSDRPRTTRSGRTTTKAIGCRSSRSSSRRGCCMPDVTLEDLTYGGSGIRPKLHPASERFADFMIRPDANHPRAGARGGHRFTWPDRLPGDRRASRSRWSRRR